MKNWQEIYFVILVVIAVVLMFAIPLMFPSETLLKVLQEFYV